MGDTASILRSPMGQPVAQIFYNVLGKSGGIFYTVCAFIIIKFVTFTGMVGSFDSCSTLEIGLTWVFPAIPWTNFVRLLTRSPCPLFQHVAASRQKDADTALRTIDGVFATTAIALDWSYCIPIVCKMLFGQFEAGPWHMGRLSWWVNAYAVGWTLFASVLFILPTVRPVSVYTMNYAIAFMGVILICSAMFWYTAGRKHYIGPLCEAELSENASGVTGNGSNSSGELAAGQRVKSRQSMDMIE
ncbi:MAG: hypothetical protein Q9169_003936 [Polycauliona sp. 2 TL-2023]